MNEAIELHDTRVTAIDVDGTTVLVTLDAYLHRSTGRPGIDVGTGWSQRAVLAIADATIEERPEDDQLLVSDGAVTVGPERFENMLPVPFDREGAISVLLTGGEGAFRARGGRVRVVLLGDAKCVEQFGCK